MKFIRKKQSIKLLFSVIWIFFFIRLTSYIDIKNNIIQFNQNNWFNFLKDSISVIIVVGFGCLLFLKIYKNYKIPFSSLLLIYPICGIIGYYISGVQNNYQDSILAHHFITISSVLLFFIYLEFSDYVDYEFKIKLLNITLIFLIIFFIFSIAPNMFWKILNTTDLRVSHKTDYFDQNVNGQTRIIFILEVISFLIFKKFFLQNKSISYIFYFIGVIFLTLILISQSRLNTLSSYIFLFFLFYNFQQLNIKNKLFFFIIIIIIPVSTFKILEKNNNRYLQIAIQQNPFIEKTENYKKFSENTKLFEKYLINNLEKKEFEKIDNIDAQKSKKIFKEIENIEDVSELEINKIIYLQNIVNISNPNDEKAIQYYKIFFRQYGNLLKDNCSKFLYTIDNIFTGRVCGWEILLQKMRKNSLIFGNGFFADQVYLKTAEKTSSNTFVNIFFNTGIIGLSIFLYFIFSFLKKNFKIKNIYNDDIYLSLSYHLILYFIFRSIFEDTLAFVSLDFLLLGISLLIIKKNISKKLTF